jgi:glycosyltransferase involved in cell wall biosynthesis
MLTLSPSTLSIALLGAMAFFAVLQLLYHFMVYGKLLKKKPAELEEQAWQPVSIIVCARSEYDNLQKLVPALLNQDYPEFEIVLVDDASWDQTTGYLEELEKEEKRVNAVFITDEMKKNYLGKKLALSLGIKAAKHELLLLTDADCLPASDSWIKHMVQPYHQNSETEIVLGYSPFNKNPGFINVASRMDNLFTAMSYYSFAVNKDPYMGVGRNLSYRKSLFFKLKGFASHLHIAPGDDDLFIRDAANSTNTAYTLNPDSFIHTDSKTSFGDWFSQKKRHNFVGKYYLPRHKLRLGFCAFTHAMFWLAFIANLFVFESLGWALILLALFWLIKLPLLYINFKKFRQASTAFWMPVFDILFVAYNTVFGLVTLFGRQKKW